MVSPIPSLVSTCCISQSGYAIESAHLVPKTEVDWFTRNLMDDYGDSFLGIHTPNNLAPMRADLHQLFDGHAFALVPKPSSTIPASYLVHVVHTKAAEIEPIYHNVPILALHRDARPYLFARFGWAILLHAKVFILQTSQPCSVRVWDKSKSEYTTMRLSHRQLVKRYGGGSSKAATSKAGTPSKRARSSGHSEAGDESRSSSSSDQDDDDQDMGIWHEEMVQSWVENRRHQQRSSETTAPGPEPEAESAKMVGTMPMPGLTIEEEMEE